MFWSSRVGGSVRAVTDMDSTPITTKLQGNYCIMTTLWETIKSLFATKSSRHLTDLGSDENQKVLDIQQRNTFLQCHKSLRNQIRDSQQKQRSTCKNDRVKWVTLLQPLSESQEEREEKEKAVRLRDTIDYINQTPMTNTYRCTGAEDDQGA
ncbi:hypothetical protein CORC01_01042 [Colletotrichum orchidophilum]|uniref:Uncharacterized protein n=1 Tax=Colletotrichum orchidophilum TaxID=1209926 RepID=A0A1G4BQU6_9PEZI|nr:uncharacterized protein CORC01_01042 [Colletotrichum orchidophilum]OHF03723.1 hypothetical protein CORC01_01042 [Colletotrichum orchidophilum]